MHAGASGEREGGISLPGVCLPIDRTLGSKRGSIDPSTLNIARVDTTGLATLISCPQIDRGGGIFLALPKPCLLFREWRRVIASPSPFAVFFCNPLRIIYVSAFRKGFRQISRRMNCDVRFTPQEWKQNDLLLLRDAR
ncbi:hypothetical protein AVEN_95162-1 [Araneus ventricosus]|uniref:Uncharacterized protein n=1 Tax=Araneus ventricosus TaxID=182803 RepID=A0A4Y2KHB2_ARAVE|nr:hypothetical protein AVEN_95162-1 [Araneus ventricosus]